VSRSLRDPGTRSGTPFRAPPPPGGGVVLHQPLAAGPCALAAPDYPALNKRKVPHGVCGAG